MNKPKAEEAILLQSDIKDWEKLTCGIHAQKTRIVNEGQIVFEQLEVFWQGTFDSVACKQHIDILWQAGKRPGVTRELAAQLQEFRALCKRYYVENEVLFLSFKQAMEAKNPVRRSPQSSPQPTPRRQPVPQSTPRFQPINPSPRPVAPAPPSLPQTLPPVEEPASTGKKYGSTVALIVAIVIFIFGISQCAGVG